MLSSLFIIVGCSSAASYEEREELRESIDYETEFIIEELAEQYPEIKTQIADAEGYASGVISNIKVPLVGGGTGIGAVYSEESTTYINLHRYDLGAGLGASSYRVISILESEQDLERFNQALVSRSGAQIGTSLPVVRESTSLLCRGQRVSNLCDL